MLRSTLSPSRVRDQTPRARAESSSPRNSKNVFEVSSLRFEKAIRYNGAQIELWKRFVNFAVQYHYIQNGDEEKAKLILERAVDTIGQHLQAGEVWTQLMDFLLALN